MSSNDSVKVAIAELERKYGSGIVMRLGDSGRKYEIKTTSTGLLSLDCAMGGGYPSGRIVEIYGPEMCGKTVLGTYALIEVQRAGRQVANRIFIPQEKKTAHALAERLPGGILNDVIITKHPRCAAEGRQADTGNQIGHGDDYHHQQGKTQVAKPSPGCCPAGEHHIEDKDHARQHDQKVRRMNVKARA